MGPLTDLNNMYFFAKVVEHGGFTSAANALGLQTSKLSRRISALEAELDVRLLNRNSRSISMTDAGRLFHEHCLAMVENAQSAKNAIDQTRASPRGVVRISCPLGVLQMGAGTIFSQYLLDNPFVSIKLDATNRRVDVIEEGLDIALRVRLPPLEDSELTLLPLLTSHRILVASPALLARHVEPENLDDLTALPTMAMTSISDKYHWDFFAPHPMTFSHQPRLTTEDLATLRNAALMGLGVTLLPFSLIQDDLTRGHLVHVLPKLRSPEGSLHAVYPSRRGMVPAVRGVLDALLEGFHAHA